MRELRMYFFVMGNIGTIDKGIQAGHCSLEYANLFGNTELYKEWFENFKTFILLSGGTSNNGTIVIWNTLHRGLEQENFVEKVYINETLLGSMELYEKYLIENNIPYASFHEPDLNNSLSALCFICDEKVFDWKNYPNFQNWYSTNAGSMETPLEDDYQKWVEFVGGPTNAKLKELIDGKRLA